MDNRLVDLDVLLTKVRNVRTRNYVLDALRAYRAGALRPAMTAIWVAVAFDLISKYRELEGHGDAEARNFLQQWDRARTNANAQQLTKLERELLEHASDRLQLLEPLGRRDLQRLQADRHLCAHPAFSTEAELFEPSAELVRLHIVNAIELLLSQRPIQGRTILNEFDRDVVSPGFPSNAVQIADYVEQRYLSRTRPATISNFGSVLAKALLRDEPAAWIPYKDKVEHSLCCLRDRRHDEWPTIEADIVRIINELEPALSLNSLRVLARFPELLGHLDQATLAVIDQSIEDFDPALWADRSFFRAATLPRFRPAIEDALRHFELDEFVQIVASAPNREFWPIALEHYAESGTFRGAEQNFRNLIAPFQQHVNVAEIDALLAVIPENNQIYDAALTPNQFLGFLRGAAPRALPSPGARDQLYAGFQNRAPRILENYNDVWDFLSEDGWQRPAEPAEDHE